MDGNDSTTRLTQRNAQGATAAGATPHKDHFLQLMFFRASPSEVTPHEPVPRTGDYAPLPTFRTRTGHRFNLPTPSAPAQASLSSRAIDVMTDLRRVAPVTIAPTASVAEANQTMIGRGVDGIITDDPELARAVVQEQATLTLVDRLLQRLADFLGRSPSLSTPPVQDAIETI